MSAPATSILDSSRAVDPSAFALGGRAPQQALRAGTAEEVAEVLIAAARDRLAVVPWGGGTRIQREVAPERYDVALDLTGLNRILEYDPEDFTATAECGVTLAALRATLAAQNQELPLESPKAERATLGGTLASNGSGPRRLRFGAPRDRILGARFALADGTLARSGGKVVKNVAGFALHRLLCGSRGGLGVFLEASLKLAPACETRAVLIYDADAAAIADESRWSFLPRLEPAFVSVLGREAVATLPDPARVTTAFTVAIGIEEDAAWAAEQERAVRDRLGEPAARLERDQAASCAQALCDAEVHTARRLTFTSAHNTIAALWPLLDDPVAARLVSHASAGRLHWYPGEGDATACVAEMWRRGYALIATAGAVTARPAFPPESAAIALRHRIQEALDPVETLPPFGPGPR